MKKFIFLALAAACILPASGVKFQKLYLKNGSVLTGYIQQQDKNDNITFRSESAVINIDGKNTNVSERTYNLAELPEQWREWAEKNNACEGSGSNSTLTLNDVLFSPVLSDTIYHEDFGFERDLKNHHSSVSKVKVLEKGAILRYIEFSPNTYTLNWKDVETIKSDRRDRTMLSGIDRTYQLSGGREVSGQYAGETYNTLSLYSPDGTVETFNIDDVSKYLYKGINPKQPIFEQTELLDIVNTRQSGSYKGFITERNFNKGDNYLVLMEPLGTTRLIKFADVTGYAKEENPAYKPLVDVILAKDEIRAGGSRLDTVGVYRIENRIALDSIKPAVVIPSGETHTKVVVEYRNELDIPAEHLMLLQLDKTILKKNNVVWSFSTDVFEMKKFQPVNSSTSVNHTSRVEYELPARGVFAIYDTRLKKAFPFIIK